MIKPNTACLKRRGKLITLDKAFALGTTIQNYLWQLLPCDKLKLNSWIWNLDAPGLWTIGFTNGLYSYFAKFHGIPLSQCLYYFISSVPLFQDRSRDSSHFLWHPVSILIKAQVIQYHGQLLASQSREGATNLRLSSAILNHTWNVSQNKANTCLCSTERISAVSEWYHPHPCDFKDISKYKLHILYDTYSCICLFNLSKWDTTKINSNNHYVSKICPLGYFCLVSYIGKCWWKQLDVKSLLCSAQILWNSRLGIGKFFPVSVFYNISWKSIMLCITAEYEYVQRK